MSISRLPPTTRWSFIMIIFLLILIAVALIFGKEAAGGLLGLVIFLAIAGAVLAVIFVAGVAVFA